MELNEETFTAAIKQAVELRGAEYVYSDAEKVPTPGSLIQRCVYSNQDGSPSCLIGQALYLIDPELMPSFDESLEEDASASTVLRARLGLGEDDLTPTWVRAAQAAQSAQDDGASWGVALDAYNARLGK